MCKNIFEDSKNELIEDAWRYFKDDIEDYYIEIGQPFDEKTLHDKFVKYMNTEHTPKKRKATGVLKSILEQIDKQKRMECTEFCKDCIFYTEGETKCYFTECIKETDDEY